MSPDDLRRRTVLIANPSPDLYGSDLQMLESVTALVSAGNQVIVTMPTDGALVPMIRDRGAEVIFLDYPVLRRANQSVAAFASMVSAAAVSVPRIVRFVRRLAPDVVYVNTVTLPWWLLASRLAGVATVCHLHEAENTDSTLVRRALMSPLHLAHGIIVISKSAMTAMLETDRGLRKRAHLIYNGVPQPEEEPKPRPASSPTRLVVVGRLSPRKAPHVALDAAGVLVRRGYDVHITLAGTAFEGYEWYVQQLEARAAEPDLAGRVEFVGYCKPIWPQLERADIAVAPSLREPFGNAVVEAQMSLRPVVAAAALGHLESIVDRETGLLVPPGDAEATADAVAELIDDPVAATHLAERARRSAIEQFSTDRYQREICALIDSESDRRRGRRR